MQRPLTHPVYLVCGVPGSGKTWVCKQLKDKFHYVPHDLHYNKHAQVLIEATKTSSKPVITECPFGERLLREELEKHHIKVIPFFVIDSPNTVKARYEKREKKMYPKNFLTRASTIVERAKEWLAPAGNSGEILKVLREVAENGL